MKQGGGRKNLKHAGGFTIVETLIVLAVSSALLLSAMALISGKQNRTAFQTSANNLQQRFQQLINQTVSGYYPGDGSFTCLGNPNGPATAPLQFTNTSSEQGSNGTCMFMGVVLAFNGPGQMGSDADKFTLFPMAGNRRGTVNSLAASYREAWPTAMARGSTYNSAFNRSGEIETTEAGLTYVWGATNGAGNTNPAARNASSIFALAMLSNIDAGVGASGLNSGSQQFSLHGFNGWPALNPDMETVVDNINNTRQLSTETPSSPRSYSTLGSAELCFASGGTNQSALYSIGSSLTVSMQVKTGGQC